MCFAFCFVLVVSVVVANGFTFRRLQQVQPSHGLLSDIQEKSEFFDTVAAKYAPRVSS